MHRKRNIVIRVDASLQIGLGHFKRCLSIAQQLHILNYNPILVLNNDFNNTNYDSAQFEIIILIFVTLYAMIALALANRNRTSYIINHNTLMYLNKDKEDKEKKKNKVFSLFNRIRYLNR